MREDVTEIRRAGERAAELHGVLDSGIAFLAKPILPAALALKVREVLDAPAPAKK